MADENLKKRVIESLESIRPNLQNDGGDIELVEIDDAAKTVKVRLQGACAGCMGAAATLEYGVKQEINRLAPEIKEVRAV